MFEAKTYEAILDATMARVPDTLDKREGSIIFDAIAPACAELAQAYIELDNVLKMTFADTAMGVYLENRTRERMITRKPATYAIVQGSFEPNNLNLVGKRFNCDRFNYIVLEDGTLMCETAGSEPNSVIGKLIPIEYIAGLNSAEITQVLVPAVDTESDDDLRQRYFDSLLANAYGGNIADYKEKTNAIDGVGGTKVTPVWNGGGTVKLTIIASDYSVPTQYLIDSVQEIIDPTQDASGVGIAPIGHIVTVEGVVAKTINLVSDVTYASGWNWESSKNYMASVLDDYFLELATAWKDSDLNVVRISQIESKLLQLACIEDIANTKINGVASNLQLGFKEIPVRGSFNGQTVS